LKRLENSGRQGVSSRDGMLVSLFFALEIGWCCVCWLVLCAGYGVLEQCEGEGLMCGLEQGKGEDSILTLVFLKLKETLT